MKTIKIGKSEYNLDSVSKLSEKQFKEKYGKRKTCDSHFAKINEYLGKNKPKSESK